MQLKLGQPGDASASLAEALAVWEGHSVPEAAQARELLAKLTAGG